MSKFTPAQKAFLHLLLNTSLKQRRLLLRAIEKSQLKAIVQIVYNIMLGYKQLPEKEKKQLAKRKVVIRKFVSKGVSLKHRKELLLKYFNSILPFIKAIKDELSYTKNGE